MNNLEAQLQSPLPKKDVDRSQIQEEFYSFKNVVQKCLLLSGVPERSDDDLITSTVTLFQRHLGLSNITADSVKSCYRLGKYTEGRSRPIVVRFSNLSCRSSVWKDKTKLKGSSLVLHEFLTKSRQATFRAAREHFGMKNVWTSNGIVCIVTPDNSRERIVSIEELGKIVSKFPKASSVSSSANVDQLQSPKPLQSRPKRGKKNAK
ncbi:hypothetical protein ACJJTC_012619 [Scirpophaga incertulas]